MFFLLQVLVTFFVMIQVPVLVLDQTWSRSLVPVPALAPVQSNFWSRPWSQSKFLSCHTVILIKLNYTIVFKGIHIFQDYPIIVGVIVGNCFNLVFSGIQCWAFRLKGPFILLAMCVVCLFLLDQTRQ